MKPPPRIVVQVILERAKLARVGWAEGEVEEEPDTAS